MKRPGEPSLITLMLLALAAGLLLVVLFGFKRVEYRRYTGYSGEAKRNSYLAAQRVLEAEGLQVRTVRSAGKLEELSSELTTLILFDRTGSRREPQPRRILEWIAAGGRCLCIIEEKPGSRVAALGGAPVLDSLSSRVLSEAGISVRRTPEESEEGALPVDIEKRFSFFATGEAQAQWTYPRESFNHVAGFSYGRGSIIALGSPSFAQNKHISRGKNLEFWWTLATSEGAETDASGGREIWFYTTGNHPSLLSIIFSEGWMLLLSMLLAAGTLIWVYAPRFGPRHDHQRIPKTDFAQHLAATGRFFSKQGHSQLLLRVMHSAALEHLHHRIPGFKRLSTAAQAEKLAYYFEISRETAHTFLTAQAELDEEGFRSFITLAERIRRWNRRSTQMN